MVCGEKVGCGGCGSGMVVCVCLLWWGRCFLYGSGDRKNGNVGVYMEKRDMDLQLSIKSIHNTITMEKYRSRAFAYVRSN